MSVDDIKLSFIDLIGQLIAMLSVVCQLSQDVLAVKTRKVIGEIQIRLLSEFKSRLLLVKIVGCPIIVSYLVWLESVNKSFIRFR